MEADERLTGSSDPTISQRLVDGFLGGSMEARRVCEGFFGAQTRSRRLSDGFPQSFDVSSMAADGFFGPRKSLESLIKSSLALSR
jgi:hypothetical protein